MEKLLSTEFVEVKARIDEGKKPLPFYYGEEEGARVYKITEDDIEKSEWMNFIDADGKETDCTRIKAAKTDNGYILKFALKDVGDTVRIDPEFKIFHRVSPVILSNGSFEIPENAAFSLFGKRAEKIRSNFTCEHSIEGDTEYYTIKFGAKILEMEMGDPFRLMIKRSGKRSDVFAPDDRVVSRLVVGNFSPDAFGFFVPEK
jgi:hypothetical protein